MNVKTNRLVLLLVSVVLVGQIHTAVSAELLRGRVVAWGNLSVPPGLTNVVAVSGGYEHCMALKSDGTVVAWGGNSYAQTNVPATLTNVVAIDGSAAYHSMALKGDGTVVAWGYNESGQCNVPPGLANVVAIAGGAHCSLALKSDGTVAGWGQDSGEVTGAARLTNVLAIAAGAQHMVALMRDRSVVACGLNNLGQTNVPDGLTNVVAVSAGQACSMALKADGTVIAWGQEVTDVPADLTNAVMITTKFYNNLALRADGTVLGWGDNSAGQTNVPAGLTNVVGIAAGGYTSLALVGYPAAPSGSYDVSRDFSLASNPNGVWSYGWKSNLAGGFTPLPVSRILNEDNGVPMEYWLLADGQMPTIKHNATTNTAISDSGQQVMPPGSVIFEAGTDGSPQNFGVIRFTVPQQGGGTYSLESAVQCYLDGDRSGDTDYHVVVNGVEVFGQFLPPRSATGYTNTLTLAVRDTVDFMVGRGADGVQYGSGLKIQATLTPVPPPCIPRQATATAVVTHGFVVDATITDGGCGYTNAPVIKITGGGGSGAIATATVSNGVVVKITILDAGSGYTNTPAIMIASPPFMPWVEIAVSKVKVTQHVVLGRNYVFESSGDLKSWNQVGPQFTAEAEVITEEFNVDVTGRFFRVREVP
jgi:hypothetical protein